MTRVADKYIADLAAEVEGHRTRAEYAVAQAALTFPRVYVPVIQSAGVTPDHFNHDDLRLIYCGADVCRNTDIYVRLRIIIQALRTAGCWDMQTPPLPAGDVGPFWNENKLVDFATARGPSLVEVEAHASLLVDVNERLQAARTHYFNAIYSLKGDPPVAKPTGRIRFVNR